MKTLYFASLLIGFLFITSSGICQNPSKSQAKQFLTRTNKVLVSAQSSIKRNKVYKGDFTMAIRHQEWSKKMYARNQFDRSIYHSRRARMLATKVIRDNSGRMPAESAFTKSEYAQLGRNFPNDRELDDVVAIDGNHNLKDEECLDQTLVITLK